MKRQPPGPSSVSDEALDGVRTFGLIPPTALKRRNRWLSAALAAVLAIGIGGGYWLQAGQIAPPPGPRGPPRMLDSPPRAAAAPRAAASSPAPSASRASAAPAVLPDDDFSRRSQDPDDIAAYIRPSDPEPTMAELIEALNEAGIHEGLGAFNPPGTSPPLQGLAVPEDFVLPEGYVRHHQVTDEGEPLEPILMYSPDFEFLDEAGQPIELPSNRVVPPEQAPPGMPIRPVVPPPP